MALGCGLGCGLGLSCCCCGVGGGRSGFCCCLFFFLNCFCGVWSIFRQVVVGEVVVLVVFIGVFTCHKVNGHVVGIDRNRPF